MVRHPYRRYPLAKPADENKPASGKLLGYWTSKR
jgi:hypothetical protein